MKKLFENIEGNKFKLLSEAKEINEGLVAAGVKKVFMNAGSTPISYHHIECVGMGYIKDITTAKKVALQEARDLMKEFGYKDSEEEAKFIKDTPSVRPNSKPMNEDGEMSDYDRGDYENGRRPMVGKRKNPETDMSNPEEKREVEIAKDMIELGKIHGGEGTDDREPWVYIRKLGEELLKIHGQQPE